MIECAVLPVSRLALNRIASPLLGLAEFYKLCRAAGIFKAELRNDLPGKGIVDGLRPREAAKIADEAGIRVISINALQKFNLKSVRAVVRENLKRLLELCRTISCPALVLCPNNDPADIRSSEESRLETADALAAFAPLFRDAGVTGLVEPLGFGISSISSAVEASDIIREIREDCYKILVDTFHHYIGPDDPKVLVPGYAARIGLLHVSGVAESKAREDLTDENRVFPSEGDRIQSRELAGRLLAAGYSGDISFEPFSSRIGALPPEDLLKEFKKSILYLTSY